MPDQEGVFSNPQAGADKPTVEANAEAPQEEESEYQEKVEAANAELREIKEDPTLSAAERDAKMNAAYQRLSKEVRPDGLDGFQRQQQKETREALEDAPPIARKITPDYSPPNTISGTEGDNANYRPDQAARAIDPNAEWDPHGGEEEDLPDHYEPAERPE